MGTTNNYNIPYPEPTDFVAQGAAAIEAVATGFDTVVRAVEDLADDNAADIGNLEAAITKSELNEQTGTSYTLVLADAGKLVTLTNAAAITLEVPDNASEAFPIGTRVDLLQAGAGQVTVDPAGGVTVNAKDGNDKLADQWSAATLIKLASDTWVLIGDLDS